MPQTAQRTTYAQPDERGRYGKYGGAFVPEVLVPAVEALKASYAEAKDDDAFWAEHRALLKDYVGRPT